MKLIKKPLVTRHWLCMVCMAVQFLDAYIHNIVGACYFYMLFTLWSLLVLFYVLYTHCKSIISTVHCWACLNVLSWDRRVLLGVNKSFIHSSSQYVLAGTNIKNTKRTACLRNTMSRRSLTLLILRIMDLINIEQNSKNNKNTLGTYT